MQGENKANTPDLKEGSFQRCPGVFRHIKAMIDRNRLGEVMVLRGLITPQDLRFALVQQKETAQPLGQILLKYAMVSRGQLALALSRQYVLRILAGLVFLTASLVSIKARADNIQDVPAKIAFNISAAGNYAKMGSYPGLFGSDEKRSTNLKPFTKWTGMFSRFDRQLGGNAGHKIVTELQENLADFQGLNLKSMAARVNDLMNQKRYILDNKNWGQSDYWATPIEFMENGGDCEDFAIAKYTALRALGVPEERLRIAIVHDTVKNIPHAVMVVYTDDGVYILDNQIKTLVDAGGAGRYRPIFSINRTAWWLHTTPDATMVASAR